MLPVRYYLHIDYEVFEGIHADFFINVLRFSEAVILRFSSK